MSEWISLQDKKPPKGKKVLWYHPAKNDDRGKIGLHEYIRIDYADLPNRPATHWAPLPESPRQ